MQIPGQPMDYTKTTESRREKGYAKHTSGLTSLSKTPEKQSGQQITHQYGFFIFKQLSDAWLNNSWTCFNSLSGCKRKHKRRKSVIANQLSLFSI